MSSGYYYDDYDYDGPGDDYDDIAPRAQAPMSPMRAYLDQSAAPLTGLLFTLPFFAVYHGGLWWMSAFADKSWGNAAEITIAWALGQVHWAGPLLSFVVVVFTFLALQHRESVPWRPPPASTFGWMAAESVAFAIPVVILNGIVHFLRRDLGRVVGAAREHVAAYVPLAADEATSWSTGGAEGGADGLSTLAKVTLSCGAGVYEEFLFRLVFMGLLAVLLKWIFGLRGGWLYFLAAVLQAVLFSAFHHLPDSIEQFDMGRFLFRTAAGVYFAYLYWERGFGIAAGAHAVYDLFTVAAMG